MFLSVFILLILSAWCHFCSQLWSKWRAVHPLRQIHYEYGINA